MHLGSLSVRLAAMAGIVAMAIAIGGGPWWPVAMLLAVAVSLQFGATWASRRELNTLKRRLARHEAIHEATDDMVMTMDGAGHLIQANRRARRELPLLIDRVVEPGEPLRPYLHALFGPACDRLIDGMELRGKGQVEESFDTCVGRRSFRMTMLEEGDGCTLCITDVTAQHDRWEAQRDQEREAERLANVESLHRLQRDFINTASHELQTPLTPLRLQARILRARAGSYLKEKDLNAIEVIERNTERMARLVEDILEVVRLENGRLPITIEPMDLGHVASGVVTDHQPVAAARGVSIEYHGPDRLHGDGDAVRIEQVIGNLVNNAIKFSDDGDVVRVGLSELDGVATITVRDEGAGMDAEEVAGLFQPFSQFHQDVRPGHGTGLGLAICHGILEAMGGVISAHSDGRGRGSMFTIQLPLIHTEGAVEMPLPVAN